MSEILEETPTGDRWYLASAPIWRALIHLCVPMMAAVSVGAVYNIINAGFIGSLGDTDMLAAITYGLPLLGLVMAVGGVFGVGAGSLIGRLLGESEKDAAASAKIKHVASFAFWGSVAVGIVVGILLIVFLGPLVSALGANAAATAATTQYVGMMAAFTPVLVAAFCVEQLVRAEGAAKASMKGLIYSTIANLVFDVLFILVLHLGVLGAGLALGLSNLVAVGYYVWFLQRRSATISLAPSLVRVREFVKPVFSVGVGELLQSSFLIVTSLLLNHLATAYSVGVIASFGVALRIVQVPEFLVMGISMGVLPLLAYAFGSGRAQRLNSGIRQTALAIGVIVVIFSGLVFLFRDQVFGLFSADASVASIGIVILTAQLVSTIFNGFTALFIAVFQGTGRAVPATIMSVAQGVLFIPIVLIANAAFGVTGLIWAMTVTEALCFVVAGALMLLPARKPSAIEIAQPAQIA